MGCGETGRRSTPPAVDAAGAVAGGVVRTPIVVVAKVLATWVVTESGGQPESHPLTHLGPADPLADRAAFLLSACLFGPLAEEFLFRGVLIPWASRARYAPSVL